jgi:chromate transporter
MSAIAAGLVVATAVKMALGLVQSERRRTRRGLAALFALMAFVAVGLGRWPLIVVAAGLAPWSIAACWKQSARPHVA